MEASQNKRLCCPCCGNTELVATTDRDVAGAAANGIAAFAVGGAIGGIASAASNLQQQNYWLCKQCGKRFRNPMELKNEADMYQKRFKTLMAVCAVFAILALIFAIVAFAKLKVGAVGVLFLFLGILMLLLPLIVRGKASSRYKQLKEIEDGMNQFR